MPRRKVLRAPHRQLCAGDLRHTIRILSRDLTPPAAGSTVHTEEFREVVRRPARVDTVSGKTFFDEMSNNDIQITHKIWIRFRDDVDTQTWLELKNGSRLRVLDTENLDERGEWLGMTCTDRGPGTIEAARS